MNKQPIIDRRSHVWEYTKLHAYPPQKPDESVKFHYSLINVISAGNTRIVSSGNSRNRLCVQNAF